MILKNDLVYKRHRQPWRRGNEHWTAEYDNYSIEIHPDGYGRHAKLWRLIFTFGGEQVLQFEIRGLPAAKTAGMALIFAHAAGREHP
jgi:hypothetical protein